MILVMIIMIPEVANDDIRELHLFFGVFLKGF